MAKGNLSKKEAKAEKSTGNGKSWVSKDMIWHLDIAMLEARHS